VLREGQGSREAYDEVWPVAVTGTSRSGTKEPPADPLKAHLELPYHHVLFPYGFPAHIRSNDASIIRAAELSWAPFAHRYPASPIELRFLVSEVPTRRRPPRPVFRAQANLLAVVADQHNFGCCDLLGGSAFACLSKAAVTNRDYMRYHFLEAMVYILLDTQHVVTVHAACVSKNGRGVLVVGDSGAGKSSFAYAAAARRGWTYVSDDASCVLRRRSGRTVLGNPRTFRFRPTASTLFPELKGSVKLRNGKPTVEIRTETLPFIKTADRCTVDYIICLDRREEPIDGPQLDGMSKEEMLPKLLQNFWPSELPIHEERFEAIERLLEAERYQLTYREFDPALDALERLISPA
jgi:hypothetical protein